MPRPFTLLIIQQFLDNTIEVLDRLVKCPLLRQLQSFYFTLWTFVFQ